MFFEKLPHILSLSIIILSVACCLLFEKRVNQTQAALASQNRPAEYSVNNVQELETLLNILIKE